MDSSLQIRPESTGARGADRAAGRRILVGFADALAAIESVWSLLGAGFEVDAFVRRGTRPPLRRVGAVRLHEIAPPELDAAASLSGLRALVGRTGVEAVMPLDDVSLRLCRDVGAPILGPTGRRAELALDKRLQLEAAAAAGLAVPPTRFLVSSSDAQALPFPLVVRPAAAVREHRGRLSSAAGATTCANERELERRLAGREEGELLMAQPQLRGVGEGLFGLATPDGVRGWSAHRRLRMMNPAGSGSSACESVSPEADLCERVERMLRDVGWSGMFMVELIRDEAGVPWFIELNGRAWGSMALARAARLEYPAWTAALALGADAGPVPLSAPGGGRRARHLGREVVHLLIVARGPRSSAVPWPSRARTLRQVLSWRRGDRVYNWRGRPSELPLLMEDTVSTVVRATSRRRGSRPP